MVRMALPITFLETSPIPIGRTPGHLSMATTLLAVSGLNDSGLTREEQVLLAVHANAAHSSHDTLWNEHGMRIGLSAVLGAYQCVLGNLRFWEQTNTIPMQLRIYSVGLRPSRSKRFTFQSVLLLRDCSTVAQSQPHRLAWPIHRGNSNLRCATAAKGPSFKESLVTSVSSNCPLSAVRPPLTWAAGRATSLLSYLSTWDLKEELLPLTRTKRG